MEGGKVFFPLNYTWSYAVNEIELYSEFEVNRLTELKKEKVLNDLILA